MSAAGVTFQMDWDTFDRLERLIANFPGNAEETIYRAMLAETDNAPRLITPLMPRSAKNKAHAKDAQWWQVGGVQSGLTTWVRAKDKYAYLYFPDDGSTTRRHAGLLNFMGRGAGLAWPLMVEGMENALVNSWELM